MTHPMYMWLHWVTPQPYLIAIYSTNSLNPDTRWLFLFICGCHKVTTHPYIIAIYNTSTLNSDTRWLIQSIYCCHGVTPYPYVIAIYSTSTVKPDSRWLILCICGCYGLTPPTPMSLLFIVRVLLSQTLDDSSYKYMWLPWSKLPPPTSSIWLPSSNPLCHRYL